MLLHLTLICSCAYLASSAARTDFVELFTPSTQTSYGSWGETEWCPPGTYATQFDVKYEKDQRNGDDTAANGLGLICTGFVNGVKQQTANPITSKQGGFGSYNPDTSSGTYGGISCNANPASQSDVLAAMLVAVRIRSEGDQGSGDDTAVNNFDFKCNSGTTLSGVGTGFGNWGAWAQCPTGSGICGLRTLVEDNQGKGDDTALNKVIFYCCSTDPNYNKARADFVDVLRSPTKTSWGTWGEIEWCKPNYFAYGADVKLDSCCDDCNKDDTGMNAIVVFCGDLTNNASVPHNITSKKASRGNYAQLTGPTVFLQMCNANQLSKRCILISSRANSIGSKGDGPVTGGQCSYDDVGMKTLHLRAVNGGYVNPHEYQMRREDWDEERECPANTAICGLRTLVEDFKGDGANDDDTAMNAVEFMCCKYQ